MLNTNGFKISIHLEKALNRNAAIADTDCKIVDIKDGYYINSVDKRYITVVIFYDDDEILDFVFKKRGDGAYQFCVMDEH